MNKLIQDYFLKFTQQFEGFETVAYADVKGLVTTGYGNLIDPYPEMKALTWLKLTGNVANADEVFNEFNRIKKDCADWWKEHPDKPVNYPLEHWRTSATIQLSVKSVINMAMDKLSDNYDTLKDQVDFSHLYTAPLDAQLALLSMAWAMGPKFQFPAFRRAFATNDWLACARECKMNEAGNPGLISRNETNRILFLLAKLNMPDRLLYREIFG